ncbi:guanylate-binding protein 1-like isoform X3 [Meleagris gallopavo]|uniref:guanylate-binding protein 1-like isoform X3 n=1 Tax=Meleagris gallopavo TaxID=9103 RepID=UPI000549C554|nr:guanylate-binding protein 1-like isoform X3 [Meleagris gallopavo]
MAALRLFRGAAVLHVFHVVPLQSGCPMVQHGGPTPTPCPPGAMGAVRAQCGLQGGGCCHPAVPLSAISGSCSIFTNRAQAFSLWGSAGFSGKEQEAAAEGGPGGVSCSVADSSKTMEAAVPPVSAPLCLVHNQDCKLSLNPAALAVLRSATQPVVVVAIVGLLSTGKSFLAKRMAQKCTGSPLSNAVQKQTKGIWMWCLPHPCKPGVTLVLLDTEGLGKSCDDDIHNDAWIFTLALLLSSTLVYNSMRTDSRTMLGSLCFLTDLKNYVRVRAQVDGTEPADEFARVFPDFVWVVRDFRLQEGDRPISADEYLDQILRPQLRFTLLNYQGNKQVQQCLRSFFPHHKMFMLERPAADRDLAQLELLREDQLQPRFRQQEEAFCQHIWKEAPVKMLLNSSPVTGRMLACLVETYMAAISAGSVPCVESVHTAVTEAENIAAVEAAVAEYRRGMKQNLVLPTASFSALMAVHQDWKKRAITLFLSQVVDKTEQHHQALLMDKLEVAKEEFCRRNEEASEQRCWAVLRELWLDMELRMQRGDYVAPGETRLFLKDLKRMQEEYKRRPDKGVKAEAVLEKFLRVKGLEMTEMWLDRVDQQCKAVLAEARAATQAVVKQLEEHQQQQVVEMSKMWMAKEMVELKVCFLEKQQKEMLAEVTAAKKVVEKQLEEQQQQQQQVMMAEVTAVKKAMEKQLEEQQQQQQQQKVMLAEVTAAKKAVEKQLEEQQQQVTLAKLTAGREAAEAQLEEQQQQVMLAEVTAVMKAMEKQLEERWQQWAQQLQEEQSLVLSQRLEELEVRLQEGHGREAAALQQVELMQEEEQTVPSWRSTLLKVLDKVVVPILIRVVNSMVNNAA